MRSRPQKRKQYTCVFAHENKLALHQKLSFSVIFYDMHLLGRITYASKNKIFAMHYGEASHTSARPRPPYGNKRDTL